MTPNKKEDTQIIASAVYSPRLSENHTKRYESMVRKLAGAPCEDRIRIIKDEIKNTDYESRDIEDIKYAAALNILSDLLQQGWDSDVSENGLTLRMKSDNVDSKSMLRSRLNVERNAQFRIASTARFVGSMEKPHIHKGKEISVRCLFGNPQALLEKIHARERVCDPYIQLVTEERDGLTGYRLSDIWRYFRYTWTIPYKTMPGRKLYYLVRDRLQPYHPVIGIFALGNSVLNMAVRDNRIGWTVDAVKQELAKKESETDEEYRHRAERYSETVYPLLLKNIRKAINDIYTEDLGYDPRTECPSREQIDSLLETAEEYSKKSINNKNDRKSQNWEEEAKTNLFKKKRAAELAKLLSAQRVFYNTAGDTCWQKLECLLSDSEGRQAVNTALIANRKCKIGSNMMDIIVCGSIPPYNELLGGKLISMLACSPVVIRDYTVKYKNQVSEIASRMKGEKVVRDSSLVYLDTTSLYAVGSSQYNRIKVPLGSGVPIEFRRLGTTEGYGTVFFSKKTTDLLSKVLEEQDGGKKIGHVFGEGTSPRLRMLRSGLRAVGINDGAFLCHHSPRIVYSVDLARNTGRFLLGLDDTADYGLDLSDSGAVDRRTQEIIEFWYNRWLIKRLGTVDIDERLSGFDLQSHLLGSI